MVHVSTGPTPTEHEDIRAVQGQLSTAMAPQNPLLHKTQALLRELERARNTVDLLAASHDTESLQGCGSVDAVAKMYADVYTASLKALADDMHFDGRMQRKDAIKHATQAADHAVRSVLLDPTEDQQLAK